MSEMTRRTLLGGVVTAIATLARPGEGQYDHTGFRVVVVQV